jgi:hypothetical protein
MKQHKYPTVEELSDLLQISQKHTVVSQRRDIAIAEDIEP